MRPDQATGRSATLWAPLVLASLTEPNWAVILAWAFAVTQLVGTTQVSLSLLPRHHMQSCWCGVVSSVPSSACE